MNEDEVIVLLTSLYTRQYVARRLVSARRLVTDRHCYPSSSFSLKFG